MSSELAIMMGVVGVTSALAALAGWTVWLHSRRRQERIHGQLELQRQALERLATAQDVTAFLGSEGGRRLLESLESEHGAHREGILTGVRRGAILTLLGIGLWLLVAWNPRDMEPAGVLGTVALSAGLGYLASAAISYRLSRRWGLLPERGD